MNEAEIKIYQSFWKNILVVVGCLIFVVIGCFMVQDVHCSFVKRIVGGWLGIIFFGGGGLGVLISTLYNRIRHIPLLIIYEDKVEQYVPRKRSYQTIKFVDVERFRLIKIHSNKLIAVDYKNVPMMNRIEESSGLMQRVMRFNLSVVGAVEALPAENLTMKGKDICDILNGHLQN